MDLSKEAKIMLTYASSVIEPRFIVVGMPMGAKIISDGAHSFNYPSDRYGTEMAYSAIGELLKNGLIEKLNTKTERYELLNKGIELGKSYIKILELDLKKDPKSYLVKDGIKSFVAEMDGHFEDYLGRKVGYKISDSMETAKLGVSGKATRWIAYYPEKLEEVSVPIYDSLEKLQNISMEYAKRKWDDYCKNIEN